MPKALARSNATTIAKTFGRNVALARTVKGMSQRQLADVAGLPDPSLLSRIEDGNRHPRLVDAINIADALGVGLELLIRD